jgi:ATP-binding cassette, subfamily B, bacterial
MANRPSHITREKAEQDKARLDDLQIEQELARQKLERSMWGRMVPLLRPVRARITVVALL